LVYAADYSSIILPSWWRQNPRKIMLFRPINHP
jgi:hypothetical protein